MSLGYAPAPAPAGSTTQRVRQTVALLRRRGYAVGPARLGDLCMGGPVPEADVRWAVASTKELLVADGLVVEGDEFGDRERTRAIVERANAHQVESAAYIDMAVGFIRALVAAAPFIRGVSIAGSLASGGFRASDDVDLNLLVEDGYRHVAYVAVNVLGVLHALRHRGKPVDDLTRRPLAPRLMTANLILERSQCRPLQRLDADMAFELLVAEPVFGLDAIREVVDENPSLLDHFPQLADKAAPLLIESPKRLTRVLVPRFLDGPARVVGETAWRYMQWTRRHKPDARARVAFVRATMRPYTLFDRR
jgi:hypothetical protein